MILGNFSRKQGTVLSVPFTCIIRNVNIKRIIKGPSVGLKIKVTVHSSKIKEVFQVVSKKVSKPSCFCLIGKFKPSNTEVMTC